MALAPRSRSPLMQTKNRQPTALIAEDEPMLRAQLRARLTQAWPELAIIAEAENGEQALALQREFEPDITFLDIRMPVKSGLEVATADGEALIRKTIKELFDELDAELFWQVHRGTIVNLRAIARVERDYRDQPLIILKQRPEKLTVSRTFAHLFKAM